MWVWGSVKPAVRKDEARTSKQLIRCLHRSDWVSLVIHSSSFLWEPRKPFCVSGDASKKLKQPQQSAINGSALHLPISQTVDLHIYCCYEMRVKVKLTEVQFSQPLDVTLVMLWFHTYVQTELLWEGIMVKGWARQWCEGAPAPLKVKHCVLCVTFRSPTVQFLGVCWELSMLS